MGIFGLAKVDDFQPNGDDVDYNFGRVLARSLFIQFGIIRVNLRNW
jgi:hypothetical protein